MAMKKVLYVFLLVLFLFGSFLIGSFYSQQKYMADDPSIIQSSAATLEKGYNANVDVDADSLTPGTVRISHEKQQIIGVITGVVEKSAVNEKLRLLGTVVPDETRLFKVRAAVDGIIQDVYESTTGSMVKKGQPLASYYSPDIYGAEQGYLIAVSSDRYRSNLQVQVTESRLLFLGMSKAQVEELKKKGEIEETITFLAPETGFVLSRDVSPEYRFQKGEELYRIAALDRVWIYADIYESEARYVLPGVVARVSHPQLEEVLQAPVSDVLPLFDAAARTLKVRLEVNNPGFLLRPDMFVDVEIPISLPPAITVPADAVLDSGIRKTVFVDKGNGKFEPREVETGWHHGNLVEIVKGLEPGERIALSGTFLIDSESRMELAGSGMQSGMSKDPVCNLEVSERRAAREGRTIVYKGRTYYFSSDDCKSRFEKNPERYVLESKLESGSD